MRASEFINEGIFDMFKKKPAPRNAMREKLSKMSTDELRQELKDYQPRIPHAKAQGSLVGGAVSDYATAIKAELDKRAFDAFKKANPDWDKNMNEGIFDMFKKKPAKPSLDLPRWPNSNNANEWMAAKAEYYAQHDPKMLPFLFSPASGDYLPMSVHVGSSWKPEHLAFYRELKKKYPEAVEKAKEITTGIAGRVSLSRVGPDEDFHGMTISESSKIRKSAKKAIPGLTTNAGLDNNNNPYLAYRFGMALAAAPGGDMDPKGEIGSNFTMVDYTDADTKMRKHAEKVIGSHSTQKTGKGSHELDSTHKVSPVQARRDYRKSK